MKSLISNRYFFISSLVHSFILIVLMIQFVPQHFRSPSDGKSTRVINAEVVNVKSLQITPPVPVEESKPEPKPQIQPSPKETAVSQTVAQPTTNPETQKIQQQKIDEQIKESQLKAQHEALLKKQAQAAQQRKAAMAKKIQMKKQALLQKQKLLQQQALQQEMANEQKQLSQIHQDIETEQNEGIIDQYKAQIIAAIEEQWAIPADADKNLSCLFMVKIAPGGAVLGVSLIKTSGNTALDRSAEAAIYKASPLPVPKDAALFDNFRELRLTVSPKKIINN